MSAITTTPFFLVELSYSPPIRVSTRHSVYYDNKRFRPDSGVNVRSVQSAGGAILSAIVDFPNPDNSFSALALQQDIVRRARIWSLETTSGRPDAADVELLLDGEIQSIPQINERVIFQIQSKNIVRHTPRRFFKEPEFNWIPASGTTITWGNNTLTIN